MEIVNDSLFVETLHSSITTSQNNVHVKTEHFTICAKDNDTTKTANIKIGVLQSWHIFTRTRTIAMFYVVSGLFFNLFCALLTMYHPSFMLTFLFSLILLTSKFQKLASHCHSLFPLLKLPQLSSTC